MLPMQILLAAFMCGMLVRLVIRLRKGRMGRGQFAVWFAIWAVGLVATMLQSYTPVLAHAVGIGRGVDMIIYASLTIIFYFLFRVSLALERLDRDITRLVRAQALQDLGPPVGVAGPPQDARQGVEVGR